jgi:hypothetical protein
LVKIFEQSIKKLINYFNFNSNTKQEKYEIMKKELNEYYFKNADKYRLVEFELNTICVAFEEKRYSFFRVEVKKIQKDQVL